MEKDFDPYYKWLGIPPRDQPPNHYRLLGIEVFEEDRDVIDAAANRVMGYLKDLAVGDEAQHSQKLLNEVSRARLSLLNREKKAAYDAELRAQLPARSAEAVGRSDNGAGRPAVAPPAPGSSPEPFSPPVLVASSNPAGRDVQIKVADSAARTGRLVRKSKGDPNPGRPVYPPRLVILLGILLLAPVGALLLIVSGALDRSSAGPDRTRPLTHAPSWPPANRTSTRDVPDTRMGGHGSITDQEPEQPTGEAKSGNAAKPTVEPPESSGQTQPAPPWAKEAGSEASSGLPMVDHFHVPPQNGGSDQTTAPDAGVSSLPGAPISAPEVPPSMQAEPSGSAADPYRDLPAAITLPPIAGTGSAAYPVGAIDLQPNEACSIALRGGERATRGSGQFSLKPVESGGTPRQWEIFFTHDDDQARIAQLNIDAANQLTFAWDAEEAVHALAADLGNCALLLSTSGAKSPHQLNLRKPIQLDALQLDLTKPSIKEDLKLEQPPRAEAIIIQILGMDGAQAKLDTPLSADANDGQLMLDVVEGGGLLVLEIKTQLKRTLQVQVTPRLRPAPGEKPDPRDLRTVSRKLEDLLKDGPVYILGLTNKQQELARSRLPIQQRMVLEQNLRQELAQAQAQLAHLQELQTLLTAHDKKLGLRLRIYFNADPEQVDLLYLGDQGI